MPGCAWLSTQAPASHPPGWRLACCLRKAPDSISLRLRPRWAQPAVRHGLEQLRSSNASQLESCQHTGISVFHMTQLLLSSWLAFSGPRTRPKPGSALQHGGMLSRISPRGLLSRATVAPDPHAQPHQRLRFVCPLPVPLARHLAQTAAPLTVHLRSDFQRAEAAVALRWPSVWVLHHPPPSRQGWIHRLYRSVAPPSALPLSPRQPPAFQDGVLYHDLSHAPLPTHAPAIMQQLLQQHMGPVPGMGLAPPSLLLVQHEGHAAGSTALRHLAQSAQEAGCPVLIAAQSMASSGAPGAVAGAYGVSNEHVLSLSAQRLTVSQLGFREPLSGGLQQEAIRVREAVYWMITSGSLSPRAKL